MSRQNGLLSGLRGKFLLFENSELRPMIHANCLLPVKNLNFFSTTLQYGSHEVALLSDFG